MDQEPVSPAGSGGDAFVVPNGATAAGHAADLSQLPGRDGFLPRWLDDTQRPVSLALVRSLGVVVGDVLVEDVTEAAVPYKPQAADTLALHRPDPAPSEGDEPTGLTQQGEDRTGLRDFKTNTASRQGCVRHERGAK